MKLRKLSLLILVPLGTLLAQDADTDSAVFELSPFVVSTDEDAGYYASQTLAGSRLKTNVGDVASSIQIITQDFLDDVGATDNNELFLYTTSTESAGLGGNFTDYAVPSDGTSYGDEDVRINPQGAQRVRGLGSADLTRNYFSTVIPSDRFNTDRVEINRGANSILFGLGSPAGIQNTGLSQAQFRNSGEIRHRMDSEGSQRFEGDFNYEVLEDKVAIRLGLLSDEQKYYQQPAFENDERVYVNLVAKPWKGATIRASYEDGVRKANRPSLVSPGYTVDFYFQGREIARQRIEDLIDGVLDINGNQLTIPSDFAVGAFDPFYADLPQGGFQTMGDANLDGVVNAMDDFAKIAIARDIAVFPREKQDRLVSHPNVSRHALLAFNWWDPIPNAAVFPGTNAIETNINSAKYLPAVPKKAGDWPYALDPGNNGKFGGYNYMATVQPWREWDPTLIPQGIQDLEIFDYTKHLLSGDAAFQNDDWKHENIALEQVFLDNKAGLELVFDRQTYSAESFVPFQGYSGIFVDLMEAYKGMPNPNFGRPFVQGRTESREAEDVRETTRLTGFITFKPEDVFEDGLLTKLIGDQTLTGLYNDFSQQDYIARFGEYMDIDPNQNQFGSTLQAKETQYTDRNKQFNYMVYLSDQNITQLNSPDEVRLNGMTSQQLWGGNHTATIKSFAPGTGELYDLSTTYSKHMTQYRWNLQDVESVAAIWNGRFLSDNLIGLVGWRRDDAVAFRYEAPIDSALGTPDLDLAPTTLASKDESLETLSWSLVGHVPENWLPGNTGLSFHYGVSENFSLEAASQDFYGNKNPSASGETKEFGFTVRLADSKLIARVNWYETTLLNAEVRQNLYANFASRGVTYLYAHLLEAEYVGPNKIWADDEGVPILVDPITGDVTEDPNGVQVNLTPNHDLAMQALNAMRDPSNPAYLPPEMIQQANIQAPDGLGAAIAARENLDIGDTEDLQAEGVEIELTWNATRNWRLSMNVAKQETVKTNYSPRLTALLGAYDSIFGINGSLSGQGYFSNYEPTEGNRPQYISGPPQTNPANTIGSRLSDIIYQEYQLQKDLEGRVSPEQRKWRVNLVTNYSFRDGRLKGFSIGSAVRWQDGAVIGYPAALIGKNDDGANIFAYDIENPHIAPPEANVDAWLRYQRKLFDGKVDWQIELRVQNLNTDADELIPVAANQTEEYSVAMWRSGSPRIYRISNSFKF